MNGGKSTASLEIVSPGANKSKGAMKVSGELIPGAGFLYAGAMFSPAPVPMEAANLSGKKTITFWAKGDGKAYSLAMITEGNQGQMPAIRPFIAGPEWKEYSFPISSFRTDGSDIMGLMFARAQEAGKFEFELDQVGIK
jgi:hypothetical protein